MAVLLTDTWLKVITLPCGKVLEVWTKGGSVKVYTYPTVGDYEYDKNVSKRDLRQLYAHISFALNGGEE